MLKEKEVTTVTSNVQKELETHGGDRPVVQDNFIDELGQHLINFFAFD